MSEKSLSRRDFLKAASTALAATGFAAMGGGAALAQEDEVNLELWGFATNREEWMEDVIAELWSDTHPNVNINLSLTPGGELWPKLVAVFVAGANIPDLVDIENSVLGQYVRDEGTKPILALNDRLGEQIDDLSVPSATAPWTVHGDIYGIGNEVNPVLLYYRHDLMDELGLDAAAPQTWDEFVTQLGPAALDADRSLLYGWFQHWVEFYFMYCQAGGQLFDEEGNPAILTDLAVEVMTWQQEQLNAGALSNVCEAYWGCLNDDVYLTITGAPWHQGFMKQNAPEQEGLWKMRALPVWSEGGYLSIPYGGTGMSITSDSAHPDECWDFIQLCNLTEEGSLLAFRRMNLFPSYTPVWENEELLRTDDYFSGQVPGAEIAAAAQGMAPVNRDPNWSIMVNAIQSYLADPVYMQGVDPRQALEATMEDFEFNR